MIPDITASAAQALSEGGLLQLVNGTWLMPGNEAVREPLRGTTATIDTQAIKVLPIDKRVAGAVEIFASNGVVADVPIGVYDRAGFFSAPWVAWLMASHGLSVSLVMGDGESGTSASVVGDPVTSSADPFRMNATKQDVLEAIGTQTQIIDARPPGRFAGTSPEPRPECRAGHIPGSLNLPFGSLKDGAGYKHFEDLAAIVRQAGIDTEKPVITSCGSGVTASAIAIVLKRLGAEDVRVYQGSWAEWGVDASLPIETGS